MTGDDIILPFVSNVQSSVPLVEILYNLLLSAPKTIELSLPKAGVDSKLAPTSNFQFRFPFAEREYRLLSAHPKIKFSFSVITISVIIVSPQSYFHKGLVGDKMLLQYIVPEIVPT